MISTPILSMKFCSLIEPNKHTGCSSSLISNTKLWDDFWLRPNRQYLELVVSTVNDYSYCFAFIDPLIPLMYSLSMHLNFWVIDSSFRESSVMWSYPSILAYAILMPNILFSILFTYTSIPFIFVMVDSWPKTTLSVNFWPFRVDLPTISYLMLGSIEYC